MNKGERQKLFWDKLSASVAEMEQEELFEYDVETDYGCIYTLKDGEFLVRREFKGYLANFDKIALEWPDQYREEYRNEILECLKAPRKSKIEVCCPVHTKEAEWVRIYLISNAGADGKISTIVGKLFSINREKKRELDIQYKAEHDSLTTVYNHATFESLAEKILLSDKDNVLFLMMDVDDFKTINDTLGHSVGDMVLEQTGHILREITENKGYAGRLGGDEFALIAWDFKNTGEIRDFCRDLVDRLKGIIFDMEYAASMGALIKGQETMDFKDVYYRADQALYSAKKKGKNRLVFYSENESEEQGDTTETEENDSMLDAYEKSSMNDKVEYVLVVDMLKAKVVYVNSAVRAKSDISKKVRAEILKKKIPDTYFEEINLIRKQRDRLWVSKKSERKDNLIDCVLGHENFLVQLESDRYRNKNLVVLTYVSLDNMGHLNNVFFKRDCVIRAVGDIVKCIDTDEKNKDFTMALNMMLSFYDADVVILGYTDNYGKVRCYQAHADNSAVMASIVEEAFYSERILPFRAFYNEAGNAFVGDVKNIKKTYPDLYKKMVDNRIWSTITKRIDVNGRENGALMVLNPRRNTDVLDILYITALSFNNGLYIKKLEDSINDEDAYDPVTGLKKRNALKNLGQDFSGYNLDSIGVIVTDVVELGKINEELGYYAGNDRLRRVGKILENQCVGYDVFRFEDDEIIVFCKDIDSDKFMLLVGNVSEAIKKLDFHVALGYSWSKSVDLQRLFKEAKENCSKDRNHKLAEKSNSDKLNEKIDKDIDELIEQGKWRVYLQPKVDKESHRTVGAEALSRLYDERFGIVGPVHYIGALEKHDVIHKLDLYMLEQVCRYQRELIDAGKEIVPISVNFSKNTLNYVNLLEKVRQIVDKYKLPDETVQIEITESISSLDSMLLKKIANELWAMGFNLAMDDFGTKYSNISMLSQFRFKVAKVDRSLVKDIEFNDKNLIMLKHLTAMIDELNLECVIEGVENQAQLDLIKDLKFSSIQGYVFGQPVPIEDFYEKFIQS